MPELRAPSDRSALQRGCCAQAQAGQADCRLPRASLPRRIGHTPSKSFALDAPPRPRSHGVGPSVRHSAPRAERSEKGTRGVCQRPRETATQHTATATHNLQVASRRAPAPPASRSARRRRGPGALRARCAGSPRNRRLRLRVQGARQPQPDKQPPHGLPQTQIQFVAKEARQNMTSCKHKGKRAEIPHAPPPPRTRVLPHRRDMRRGGPERPQHSGSSCRRSPNR